MRNNLKRMGRKAGAAFLGLLLLFVLTSPAMSVHAEGGDWNNSLYRFNQFIEIVSESEFNEIEDLAYDNVEIYRFDFPIVVVGEESLGGYSAKEYAEYYYQNNDYGFGPDRSGILFLLVEDTGEFLIRGFGCGEDFFTGETLQSLNELYYSTYAAEGYGPALLAYLNEAQLLSVQAVGQAGGTGAAEGYLLQEDPLPMVYDAADIFTDAQEAQMNSLISGIRSNYSKDFVVYTDTTSYGKSHGLQAADFYWDNGYGSGSGRDGGVLFICMESGNRGWWSAATGDMQSYFSENNINDLDDRLEPYMVEGEYGEGVIHYLQDLDVLLKTGKVPHQKNYVLAGILSLVAGLLAGGVNRGRKTAAMNTIRGKSTASNYVLPGSLVLKRQQEHFVRTYVNRVYRPKQTSSSSHSSGSSSYSGGYHSSGGGSFSGGGRKF